VGDHLHKGFFQNLMSVSGMGMIKSLLCLSSALRGAGMPENSKYEALEKQLNELQDELSMYRQLVNNLNDVLYRLDRNATITYVSPNVERIAGYAPAELVGRNYADFLSLDDSVNLGQNFQRILAGETVVTEHKFLTQSRGAVWVITRARPIFENGNVTGVQGTLLDITERKQAEAALLESEARYRHIIENAGDIIFTVNGQGCFVYMSPNCDAMLGYKPEAFIGESFESFVCADDMAAIYNALLEVFTEYEQSGGEKVNQKVVDFRALTRDGQWKWLSAKNTILRRQEEDFQMVAIARDVTEQKAVEQALKESEERYRFLVEESSDIIWIFSLPTMTYTYASRSVERLLGYAQEEVIGFTNDHILTPEAKKQVLAAFEKVARGGSPTDRILLEVAHQHKNGGSVWLEVNAVLNRDSLGQPVSFTGISRDINPRKQAEAERERLQDQLRQAQKMEALGRMAGAVAHHFNNQLNVVLGNLEMAMEDMPAVPGVQHCLNEAVHASHRAAHISAQMLAYLGRKAGSIEKHDLSELCRRHLSHMQTVIAEGVHLALDLDAPGPFAWINEEELKQALTGLVINASEAIEGGAGRVVIRTRLVSAPDCTEADFYPAGWVPSEAAYGILEVADTGSGIRRAHMEKIFDPFFSTRFTGRGLGLAVVLGMARARGGAVSVQSRKGQGTTLRIFLPAAD